MIRRVVVFPQPDGPRRVAKEPFGTSKETSSTAVTPPNRFVTCETRTCAVSGTSRSQRDAPASEDREDEERDDRHADVGNGVGGRGAPVKVAHELIDADRGGRRRRREQEDHKRESRDGADEGRDESDPQ